ncbi:MAG: hypothetical protein K2J13_04270 [Clostridia bacterium]|nr:hypothetical protein [Clostridia bacterium]
MKKKIALLVLFAILLTTCLAMFCACTDEEPESREVVLELINPTTDEIIKSRDIIDLPPEKTLVEVRIKDKETGEYLTDDDLPGTTVKESYKVYFKIRKNKEGHLDHERYGGYWPTKEDIEAANKYNHCQAMISFDCRSQDSSSYRRKYKQTTGYVTFSFNIDNLWEDVDVE